MRLDEALQANRKQLIRDFVTPKHVVDKLDKLDQGSGLLHQPRSGTRSLLYNCVISTFSSFYRSFWTFPRPPPPKHLHRSVCSKIESNPLMLGGGAERGWGGAVSRILDQYGLILLLTTCRVNRGESLFVCTKRLVCLYLGITIIFLYIIRYIIDMIPCVDICIDICMIRMMSTTLMYALTT